MRAIDHTILSELPDRPGIYLFYNVQKELVYVGKAVSLRSRVKSYFIGKRNVRPIEDLIHEVHSIQWKEADSALEAAILEAIYIKKHLPKYNVIGKDDKSWNYIVITKEAYPRVETVRQHELFNATHNSHDAIQNVIRDTRNVIAHIFGPFPGMNTKATMKVLRKLFQFSTCHSRWSVISRQSSVNGQKSEDSRQKIGDKRPCFYYQMGQCLGVCTGEISPAEYKKKIIRPLVLFLRGQKRRLIISLDQAMVAASRAHNFEEAARLRDQIRHLNHIQDISMINTSFVQDDGLEIYSHGIRNQESEIKNQKSGLVMRKIEGYDISNLGSSGVVGSLVVFMDGQPDTSLYRKFRIKTFEGQSDVGALKEVITRRLRHALVNDQSSHGKKMYDTWPLPDVFLIDGGVAHVNIAKSVLREAGISRPVIGIAKGPQRKRNDIVLGTKKHDIVRWAALHRHLLISVRDEAHRFAVGYQRQIRKIRDR